MSHITRRKFLAGSAAVVGSALLPPITYGLPSAAPAAAVEAAVEIGEGYAAFAEALVAPILREIREASVMRQILAVENQRTYEAVGTW